MVWLMRKGRKVSLWEFVELHCRSHRDMETSPFPWVLQTGWLQTFAKLAFFR